MIKKLTRVGSSKAIIFDKTLLGLLEIDDEVVFEIENKKLIVKAAPKIPKIAETDK